VKKTGGLLVIVTCACLFACGQLARVDAAQLGNMKADKILFLGNSISTCPPNWWGLSASTADKDYIHLLAQKINAATGGSLVLKQTSPAPDRWYHGNPLPNYNGNIINVADIFERNYNTWKDNARIQNQLDWKADIVVLQFGENMANGTIKEFEDALDIMLTGLKNSSNPHIFVTGFTLGKNLAVDAVKKKLCAKDPAKRVFVDLSGVGRNPANIGSHNHPSDAGMAEIADTLFKAMVTHSVSGREKGVVKKETVRDRLWLWSHLAGSYNGQYKLQRNSDLSPAAAAEALGMKNICMVRYGGKPAPDDFAGHMKSFGNLKHVVWSVIGDGSTQQINAQEDLTAVIEMKRKFGNLSGAVLDDFFLEPGSGAKKSRISLDELKSMQSTLHKHGLKLWIVLYDHQLEWDIAEYLQYCDVITFWTWKSEDLDNLEENLKTVKRLAGQKPVLVGCYLYDFGNQKPISARRVQAQCEQCYGWMKNGDIEGVIFCSNCVADLGLEAVEWTKRWIAKIGDETLD